MAVDELKHAGSEGLLSLLPKGFTVSAAGTLMIGGLSVYELIGIGTALSTLLGFWFITALTIKQKRKANRLLDLEIAERERQNSGTSNNLEV